jgi:CRISPR-associated protein Cas2
VLVLVTYDVRTETAAGRKRLRRVAAACLDYGQRVQYSVFECDLDPARWAMLRARLIGLIDPEQDSLRFYMLGANWRAKVEHVGAKPAIDYEGPLIF